MKINDVFTLPLAAVEYAVSRLTDKQRVILYHLANGKSATEIAAGLGVKVSVIHAGLTSACDRAGVKNRYMLMAIFAVWRFARIDNQYRYDLEAKDRKGY